MTTTIGSTGNQITLTGNVSSDWAALPVSDMVMTAANTVPNYQVYGGLFLNDPTYGNTYVIGIGATPSTEPVIAAGTVIYLNTDQNNTTGYSPFGNVGAEYEVQFAIDTNNTLQAYLYSVSPAGVTTPLNGGAPIPSVFSSDGESVELAIPQSLLTPTGGTAPTAIDFDVLINNATALPSTFSTTTPQYIIADPAAAPPPTKIANTITLDGSFTDWPAADVIMTPGNTVSGYQVYGAFLDDATLGNTYVIGIDATNSADPAIAAGTTIYLNTDQNTATGYSPFGNIGAEYEVQFAYGPNSVLEPFLYSVTSTGVTTRANNGQPLAFGMSSNGESVELAIPQSALTPSGGTAPTSINFAVLNGAQGLPADFTSNQEYLITDPAALTPVNHNVKKVGIVYSATTAALYFGLPAAQAETAYADLFMTAQHQAEAAGVSYDLLSEADLTNVAKLSQYSALIFPDFQNVQSGQASAIANALYQVVYQYHVPIITAGDFMTNDQNGNPLPGNSYANMQSLLNLTNGQFATGATYSVTPDATALAGNNPNLAGYTSGQLIGGASGLFPGTTQGYYTGTGYTTFNGYTQAATTLADINVQNVPGGTVSATLPGVEQTTTGGTNTEFATTGLFGDSNLLQHVIQNTVFGTTPSLTMDITRFNGVVNSRTDMDQSQFPTDVAPVQYDNQPAGTKGIYDVLLNTPVNSVNSADNSQLSILAYLKQQYDFVGSYFINIGDNTANNNFTNWAISTPYYDQLLQLGNEIGTHSYTHLINPSQPTTPLTATTTTAASQGATQVTVSTLPSYNGATLGMYVTDAAGDLGTGTSTSPFFTYISGYSVNPAGGYILDLTYQPGGYGTANVGALKAIQAGTALNFTVPTENTNFLSTGATDTTGTNPNFTYGYEFGQSKTIEQQNLGITIAGAAVPGANDYLPDSQNILSYFPTANGVTGYVNGGWTGVGSGSPNAFGYITPSNTSSVYIAPNITFDFSEIQYQNKSAQSGLADWENLFTQLSANSETPVIVWPWHDYGITDWPTGGIGTTPPGYTEALYQSFIQYAYNAGDEFVTSEELAQRTAAEQAATISESTSGNVITASVTPGASEPDLGAMALNIDNGAAGQVIKNAGSWYAYDTKSVFLANDTPTPTTAESFTVTLGATQDDVTHVDSLAMRADLQSVTGDGTNLTVSFTGDGTDDFHLKAPGANIISVNMSIVGTEGAGSAAPAAMLAGQDLKLVFNDGALAISSASPQGVPVQHTVSINEGATAVVSSGAMLFNVPVAYLLANLTGVSADPLNSVASISLAGTGMPTLTMTLAQAVNDAMALSKIVTPHTVAVADTAANIAAITSAQAAALKAAGVTSIASTNGAVTMTLAEAQLLSGDGIAVTGGATATATIAGIAALTAAQVSALIAAGYKLMVSDTAADIAAITSTQASALKAAGITSIASTTGAVTMTLAEAQLLLADGIAVTGGALTATASVAALLALTSTQASALTAGGYALQVSDTAANVVANLDLLQALAASGEVFSIQLTDSGTTTLTIAATQLTSDAKALADITSPYQLAVTGVTAANAAAVAATAHVVSIAISDSAANVATNLDALQTLAAAGKLTTIALTDSGTPTLTITATQLTSDAKALADLTGSYQLAVTGVTAANAATVAAAAYVVSVAILDSAANVATNLNALQTLAAAGKLASIALTAGGTTTLTVAIAQAVNDATALSKITGPHTVGVTDTAANIAAITSTQANALKAAGVTSLASTTGAVTMTLAEAQLLLADGIAVTGGALTATASVAAMLALTTTQASTLTSAGYALTALDTAANIQKLTTANIATLQSDHLTKITASSGSVGLTLAQATALEGTSTTPAILVRVPTGSAVTVTDTSAHLNVQTAFSPTVIQNLKAIGVSSIVSSGGAAVTVNVAQTQALANAALKITSSGGINVTATDTASALQGLTAAQITALPTIGVTTVTATGGGNVTPTVAQAVAFGSIANTVQLNIGTNIITDTAANIGALTATQIATINNLNSTQIKATDTTVNLTLAQAAALGNDGFTVSAPSGSVVEAFDTAAHLQALSDNAIYGLPDAGVSKLVSNNGNVTFNASQTSDFAALHLLLSATGTSTVSATMPNNGVIVSSGSGNLTLSTNSNNTTVNAGASALSVTQGGEAVSLAPSNTETITATGRTNDTFAFTSTFGNDTLTGLLLGTSSTHDILQFSASAFGAGLTSANQSADLMALLVNTTNNSAGNAVITDVLPTHDSVTLIGVSKATLALAANSVDFKFV